ncbi:hypothetical protein Lesp02_32960 [Lentzea sp. NBRC 105346]|uniref:LPXTG cell wall anchor domain-containing protein n=1 Tax=Lentzea sp. NBRC 105346 TaxID=3032205 RepID=UPI00249FB2D6|nr:LPXTG cell wall anchor domain-containing protein [Lentzea sp. NBRC 105346]GLZ31108.1 hypothetical protein Lesp02_32960 [Lentzea sp. NBRC 105346]
MALPRLISALVAASFAVTALATTASAAPDKPLISGDARASVYAGNVAPDHDDACTVGKLTGEPIANGGFTFTGGDNQADLDITAVPSGFTVTGVVVKGGPAYNVYLVAQLGALPWNDLHAPLNDSGSPAAISHWYACGIKTGPTSEKPREEQPKEEQPSSSAAPTSSTSTSAPAPAGAVQAETEALASTGFGSPWLIGLGAALVTAGAGVLFFLRRKRA